MPPSPMMCDGLCTPAVTIHARQLVGLVCAHAGADCPLIGKDRAREILEELGRDPTLAIRLASNADEVPHYETLTREGRAQLAQTALDRKRDLGVLQKLGLAPGDTRRGRYLFELLFKQIETLDGLCAYDTPGWEGCPVARQGVYERVREKGWREIVYCRDDAERADYRQRSAERVDKGERLYVRPHHFMCMACWLGGRGGDTPRPNDVIYEIYQRVRREPDVEVMLVEGQCIACDCCDGFHPANGRCVHAGGLIRDYKKDLDVLQKLGLMPGARIRAREFLALLFERVQSTTDVCGYGDGVATANEWRVCGGPDGNAGYARTRARGVDALIG